MPHNALSHHALSHNEMCRPVTNDILSQVHKRYEPYRADGLLTYRYEERGGTYTLHVWGGIPPLAPVTGPVGSAPEWVQAILEVAKVGGHLVEIVHTPPDRICWFTTTPEHELAYFGNGIPHLPITGDI